MLFEGIDCEHKTKSVKHVCVPPFSVCVCVCVSPLHRIYDQKQQKRPRAALVSELIAKAHDLLANVSFLLSFGFLVVLKLFDKCLLPCAKNGERVVTIAIIKGALTVGQPLG